MTCTIDLLSPTRVVRSAEQAAKRTELVAGATNEAEDKILRVLCVGTLVSTVSELSSLTGLSAKSAEMNLKALMGRNLVRISNDPIFGTPRYQPCGTY